jgi:protein phosphatase
VVQELVDAGVIAPEMADSHPESNVLTRAPGVHDEPLPDSWRVPVRAGLRLLICSDGLPKEVGDDRLRLHLASGMPAAETASALVDAALAAGGRDNVTLIVVDVIEAPRAPRSPKHDTQATQEHPPAAPDLGRTHGRPPSGGNPG